MLTDKTTVKGLHKGKLPLHHKLSTQVCTAKILPQLKSSSLISIVNSAMMIVIFLKK